VLPVTSMGLRHPASEERIPSGVARLDEMLGGKGYYRGSSVLVSGTAGTGKTSIAAHLANATCARGERCLYFAFEESPDQIVRNMRTIGIDLGRWRDAGLLRIHSVRPSLYGLELHLATMHRMVRDFDPRAVIVDPISNLDSVGGQAEVGSMLVRLVDWLKGRGVTTMFTNLNHGGSSLEATDAGISSLVDTWLLLRDIELGGERNRGLYVLKSRGMAHSNQIREFVIGESGVDLLDPYVGPEGVLTGSMRISQEAREQAARDEARLDVARRRRALERRRVELEARMAALRSEIEADEDEARELSKEREGREREFVLERQRMARSRRVAPSADAKDAVEERRR
jgi:circadian clock protein KaiC